MIAFRAFLIAGLLVIAALYLSRGRSPWRDRFAVIVLFSGLVTAVLFPGYTSWIAERVGVGRGVDLAIYVGFLLVLILLAMQRARTREQQRMIAALVRELALLRARAPSKGAGRAAGDQSPRGR